MLSYTLDKQLPFLKDKYNVFVFHISKLTRDRSKKNSSENLKNDRLDYKLTDVSNYSVKELILLMKKLRPKIYMSYTYNSSFDYLLYNVAKMNGISSVFHDHGVVFGTVATNTNPVFKNINTYKIKRFISFNLKLISLSLLNRKAKIISNFYNPKNSSQRYPNFDKYLFYSPKNVEFFSSVFTLKKENHLTGGVPCFDDKNQYIKLLRTNQERQILYIHQPLVKFGFSYLSKSEEIEYYKKLNKIALKYNYKFIIRLHPNLTPEDYPELKDVYNMEFDLNDRLQISIAKSKIVLGHWSTALSTSLALNKPTFILVFPNTIDEFKNYYNLFGESCIKVYEIDILDKLIEEFEVENSKLRNDEKNDITYLIGENNTYENNAKLLNRIVESI